MMVLNQACYHCAALVTKAAMASASLLAVCSHSKPTLIFLKQAGCPIVSDPPWSPPVPCHSKEGPAIHKKSSFTIHSHWSLHS